MGAEERPAPPTESRISPRRCSSKVVRARSISGISSPISREQVENQLNFLGLEGWELVQIVVMNSPEIPYQGFFKRLKSGK